MCSMPLWASSEIETRQSAGEAYEARPIATCGAVLGDSVAA